VGQEILGLPTFLKVGNPLYRIASRIVEITSKIIIDRLMTFNEYLIEEEVKGLKAEMQ
jgi:hypothetical protein